MPVGKPPIYPQATNQGLRFLRGQGQVGTTLNVAPNAFFNSGAIGLNGTLSPISEPPTTLLGNPGTADAIARDIPVASGLSFNAGGTLVSIIPAIPVTVPEGGTGHITLNQGAILLGNGTSAISALSPGSIGNLIVSNGTIWNATTLIAPPPSINAGALGVGLFPPAGFISNQVNGSGVSNTIGTADTVLFSYALPANSLDIVGRAIALRAYGDVGANSNAKNVKFFINTMPYSFGSMTISSGGWVAELILTKNTNNGQLGSGTLIGSNSYFIAPGMFFPNVLDTSIITISVTGASPIAGAAGDVTAFGMSVLFLN